MITGIQPSGRLHMGNYFGAIKPSSVPGSVVFIADYHALTTANNAQTLRENVRAAVATVGALLPDAVVFRQSQFHQVQELAGILGNVTPTGLLARAVSYKDKVEKGLATNLGLFSYPVLMTADILAFGGENPQVPVGPDQVQHLNIAADIIGSFNAKYATTLPVPTGLVHDVQVPGTDGQKMSKSYGNIIPIIGTDNEYKKAIAKIVTDCAELDEPKEPSTRITFQLYSLIATDEQREEMAAKYLGGGYGDGHAKVELCRRMIEVFSPARERYEELLKNPHIKPLPEIARRVDDVLQTVRDAVGL